MKYLRYNPDACVAVSVEETATPRLFKGRPSANIAFGANYSWVGIPIGYVYDAFDGFRASISKYNDIRPILAYDGKRWRIDFGRPSPSDFVAVQAGPTLLIDGGGSVADAMWAEKFRKDVARMTEQVSVGVKKDGGLVVMWTKGYSLQRIANVLKSLGCDSALKMDGGSKACLKVGNKVFGNPRAAVGVEFI